MLDATCLEPTTCTRCGHTEGEALGHDMRDATCLEPATCTRCGHTEGEALGHAWSNWRETLAPTYVSDGCEIRVCGHDASHVETRVKPAPTPVEEWSCGASVTARLYPDAKEAGKYNLHVFGSGAMENYTTDTMPWVDVLDMITRVTVYEGVTDIGNSCFRGCTALHTVVLANSVTVIGESAFRTCVSLGEVSRLENIETIGKYAFYDCSSLTSISFGENATLASVGTYAFSGCDNLKLLFLHNETAIAGLVDYDVYGYLLSAIESVVIPANIDVPTYITDVYAYGDVLIKDGASLAVYSFHSHALDAETWKSGAHGMTCTECGLLRDFAGGEAPLYAQGDINGDGVVDIADIVALINAASGTVLDPAVYPGMTDLNSDEVVDIADIVAVINIASGAAS